METIANETEAEVEVATNPIDQPRSPRSRGHDFVKAVTAAYETHGELIEPTAATKAAAAAAGDPYSVVVRCAPRYNGAVHQTLVRRSWAPVAQRLAELGRERALLASARGNRSASKAENRTEVQQRIRTVWREEAEPLKMSVQMLSDLLGITRQATYSILDEKVGGKGLRGTEPSQH